MREERFSTPHPVRLDCSVTSGSLTIAASEDAKSTVSLEGPQQVLDAMRVELIGDRLVISEPRSSFLDIVTRTRDSLQVAIGVPTGSAIMVKTASSDVALDGSFGEIEMQSASADLRVTGEVDGDVTVKSASGDVRLPDVHGQIDVRGVSGDLYADSVDGSVTVTVVSGDVRIESLREGTVSVRSVSGDVALGIAPGSAVDLDASTASGDLVSEVPLSDTPAGDAGPTVVIRGVTASGDIRVFRAVHAPAV
ncbi:MAG TPA: DUF4097 family beta strand repeat-containing protein [Solirubrobacteraceae bacterium]|jgi:hypothetical protein